MSLVPRRITLVVQVADALRSGIRAREWSDRLPAEKILAEKLQVSRMTLRSGMKLLIREGLIQVARGQRARIVADLKLSRPARRASIVGVISPIPVGPLPHGLQPLAFGLYYDSFRRVLEAAGYQVKFFTGLRYYQRDPAKSLESLLHEANVDSWVVTSSNAVIQRWFAHRQIPVVIDGLCQPGIRLAALDVDYSGVCRHAASTLLGLGHKRIVYLSTKPKAGGDFASEAGFREGFQKFSRSSVPPQVVHTETTPESVAAALGRLLRAEQRPTAILAGRAEIAFSALTYLLGRGVRVPGDVSLVCRDTAQYFTYLIPSLTQYVFKSDPYAKHLARMTMKLFDGALRLEQQFVLPVYVKGNSIGPCREA